MNENLKGFAQFLSENKELADKLNTIELTEENYREEIIKYALENGYDLKVEDFAQDNRELDTDELNSVAGGLRCNCFIAGGGTQSDINKACGCVAYGEGNTEDGRHRCVCIAGGTGEDLTKKYW